MTNPEIVDVEDYTLDCNEDWPESLTTDWTDNCSGEGEVESDEGVPDGESEDGNIEYKLYTFTVSDNCGNTAEETTRVGRIIEGGSFELTDDNSLFFKCITEDFEFDLFSLLIGIDSTNNNGEWYMSYGGITTLIVGGIFNPSSLLDAFGEYDEDQLGDYLFTYVLDGVCPTEAIIEIHDDCIPLDCNPIAPDTALTPNGDGIHDTFFGGYGQDARAAGCTMHLQIFNRWGVKIFEDKDYKNDWNGRVQSNAIGSSGTITTGTYFYIITYSDSAATETIKGYIYVATE
jgi:gliding motility-associated-like protein